jgi:excisionase family DNA binding protein
MMNDRWFSVEEISHYLGVSADTVYIWMNKRGMPGHRAGRLWKFKTIEVDDWVKSGRGKKIIKSSQSKHSKKR